MKSRLSLAAVFAILMGIAACGGQGQAPAGGGAGTEAPATSTTTAPGAAPTAPQGTTGQAGY